MDTVEVHGHSLGELEDYSVARVDPQQLQSLWPAVFPHLVYGRKHLEEYLSLEDVYVMVYSGQMQMWLGINEAQIELVGLTQALDYPRCRALRFVWIGGSGVRHYQQYLDWLELCAKRNGCGKIEVLGRPGWLRVLAPHGYEPKATLLVKDISGITEN